MFCVSCLQYKAVWAVLLIECFSVLIKRKLIRFDYVHYRTCVEHTHIEDDVRC